jgi:hypothetical protein
MGYTSALAASLCTHPSLEISYRNAYNL